MSRPISAAYLERKLRAITGAQGDSPLPDLEALQGLLVLEGDRPEWSFPANELFGWGRESAPAVAGENAFIALRNPNGSGVLAILQMVQVISGGPVEWFWNSNLTGTPLIEDGSGTGQVRDMRRLSGGGLPVLACSTSFGAQVGAVGTGPWISLPPLPAAGAQAFGIFSDGHPCLAILPPNTAIVLRHPTVNLAFVAAFGWRERPFEGTYEIK